VTSESGFIANETRETDELGLIETNTRTTNGKNKGKAAKTRQSQRRKTLQKPRYVFLQSAINKQAYKDYFNPDPEVEKKVLALSDLVSPRGVSPHLVVLMQQLAETSAQVTQEEGCPGGGGGNVSRHLLG